MNKPTDTNEPSPASAGSHGSPVAWVAFAADASESRALFLTRDAAERAARKHGWFVAELFARPTLTDEERRQYESEIESLREVIRFEQQTGERIEEQSRLTDEERHFLERCADASGSAGEAARSILRRFT
jgi:hypothetical protein